MILFFDTYITDVPLNRNFVAANDRIRCGSNSYKMPTKIDIAKYTLSSYAEIPWSTVIIRYGFALGYNDQIVKEFGAYVKKLFPKSKIFPMRGPTLTQKDFSPILEIINKHDDQWIFYAPNNDHPIIANSYQSIYESLSKGNEYLKKYNFTSIVYSHYSEFIRAGISGNRFHDRFALDATSIEDCHECSVFLRKNGDNSSVQIVSKQLFNYWFSSHELGNKPIMRAESLREYFLTHKQLMIVPKKEICAHFDGYSHTIGSTSEILPSLVPPLFIPHGYFEGKIKIAFGYDNYRKGWVNINPEAKYYVFDDPVCGTDLKILLSDLPMCWRRKVIAIDINKKIDWSHAQSERNKYYKALYDPWTKLSLVRKILAMKTPRTNKPISTIPEIERLSALGLMTRKYPLKLHLGCGPRVIKGWINIDLGYEPYENYLKYYTNVFYPPNIRGNKNDFYGVNIVGSPLPIANNSASIVFHEDFIEHLDQKEQYILLAETLRILEPGGIHRINTPEITSTMNIHSCFKLGMAGVYQPEWDKHVHKNILSISTLTEMAKIVGYRKIVVQNRDISYAKIPKEYRPDPKDRPENGNMYIDLVK